MPELIRNQVYEAIKALLSLETPIFRTADVDRTSHLSLKEQVELRRFLRAQQYFLAHEERVIDLLVEIILSAFAHIIDALPAVSQDTSTLRVPLLDLLTTNPGDVIGRISSTFLSEDLQDVGLFTDVREIIYLNACKASGIRPYEESRKEFVPASKANLPPTELVEAYLGNTPFAKVFNIQVPFVIPREIFGFHGVILAPLNHGKTQLLGNLIAGFLDDPQGPGLFVLDPHGDFYSNLAVRVDRKRLVTLDPDTDPPPLNFLDFGTSTETQTLQTFSYLMSSLSGGLSDKQKGFVPYLLALLRRIPDASLDTLRILVDEKVKRADQSRFWPAMQSLPDADRDFFENVFYASRVGDTKEAIAWRLYSALSSPTFREMFSAKKNSFDAAAAMHDRKIVLVKGSENALGEAGMPIFLQFIVSQVFLATLKRAAIPKEQRHLCLLICDEASHIFNHQTTRILTECRKWGLGFLAATQLVEQIPTEVKAAIYGATAIKIAGPVSSNDAHVIGREMYTTGDFIRSMKAVERSHADFAFYVKDMTDRAVRVRVPYGRLEEVPETKRATRIAEAPFTPPHAVLAAAPLAHGRAAARNVELAGRVASLEPPRPAETSAEPPRPVATEPARPETTAGDVAAPPAERSPPDDWRS